MSTEKMSQAFTEIEKTRSTSTANRIIHENIEAILAHRKELAARQTVPDVIANRITDFSGRIIFVVIHAVWFLAWFLLNSGWFGLPPFDPFPYGLLTMIVSLEAIFLSTFILISQNQNSKAVEHRAELDLQINLLTERELTRVLLMLDEVQQHLGIIHPRDEEILELEKETKTDEVLKQIEEAEDQQNEKKG